MSVFTVSPRANRIQPCSLASRLFGALSRMASSMIPRRDAAGISLCSQRTIRPCTVPLRIPDGKSVRVSERERESKAWMCHDRRCAVSPFAQAFRASRLLRHMLAPGLSPRNGPKRVSAAVAAHVPRAAEGMFLLPCFGKGCPACAWCIAKDSDGWSMVRRPVLKGIARLGEAWPKTATASCRQ